MLLLVNVDDISGEIMPYLIDGLMERGADSVHVVQAITKKGRLEFLFFVDAPQTAVETLAAFLASETGTLGVRVFDPQHIRFSYRICPVQLIYQAENETVQALIRVKYVTDTSQAASTGEQGQVVSVKAEQEDLRRALGQIQAAGVCQAHGRGRISLPALKRLVEQAALAKTACTLGKIQATLMEEHDEEHSPVF